jgi:hypothetical protein
MVLWMLTFKQLVNELVTATIHSVIQLFSYSVIKKGHKLCAHAPNDRLFILIINSRFLVSLESLFADPG